MLCFFEMQIVRLPSFSSDSEADWTGATKPPRFFRIFQIAAGARWRYFLAALAFLSESSQTFRAASYRFVADEMVYLLSSTTSARGGISPSSPRFPSCSFDGRYREG